MYLKFLSPGTEYNIVSVFGNFHSMQSCLSYCKMLLDLTFHRFLNLAVETNTRVPQMLCSRL